MGFPIRCRRWHFPCESHLQRKECSAMYGREMARFLFQCRNMPQPEQVQDTASFKASGSRSKSFPFVFPRQNNRKREQNVSFCPLLFWEYPRKKLIHILVGVPIFIFGDIFFCIKSFFCFFVRFFLFDFSVNGSQSKQSSVRISW